MITREQVKDLRGGDFVELHRQGWPDDVVVRGTLRDDSCAGELWLGDYSIFSENGNEPDWLTFPGTTLTVVYRAPRPLYVNHNRTEARAHDVVRDGAGVIRHHGPVSDSTDPTWWAWEVESGFRWTWTSTPPQPLILLVDGVTGQVVP